ncbi:hypothetical protein MMYC01_204666 [Madurella mycetomatis]|uniref:Uncharacterized protein n=1 Tax=Madurella mycetomatis TaxID=100816 RepID=A0A175W9F8_9PEZI|nr:hypothetical protein MMYC01_204666 [Madurella mycetomatis]
MTVAPPTTEDGSPAPSAQQDAMLSSTSNSIIETKATRKKTQTEIDEELRMKMEGISGDGGESGVEYEDGRPVTMKRGVRENMFRYI